MKRKGDKNMYQSSYQRNYGQPYPNTYGMSTYNQNPYPNQQMMGQPQPQSQPQMQPQNQTNLPPIQEIRYATEEEAKAFIVYPNASAYFFDLPKNRLYIKSANASGISNIEYFDLMAINADGTPIKPQEQPAQVDFSDFLKKSDLNGLGFVTIEQYNSLAQKLEQLQKQISTPPKTNNK